MPRRKVLTFETATGEDRWALPVLSHDQVMALEPSSEMVYAARAIGISRNTAHRQARTDGALRYGDRRVPVQKVGRMWRFRRADLLDALGIDAPTSTGQAAPTALAG